MKNSRFTYLLLLVFLYTQTDNVWAAVRCYSRQGDTTRPACSMVRQCCHRSVEPGSCPSKKDTGLKESKTCPLRTVVTKTLEAYEKHEPVTQRNAFCAPFSLMLSINTIQLQNHVQPAGIIDASSDLFILQSVLRI